MSVVLDLEPEVEAALTEKANAKGLPLSDCNDLLDLMAGFDAVCFKV